MASFVPAEQGKPQRESIYEQLRQAILSGAIGPGERLVETTYAEIFHVSRTPIREAIRMLEQDELVIYEPRKGAVVRPQLSEKEMEEVYTIRAALQMLTVEEVIRNITEVEITQMIESNSACIEALESDDSDAYFYHLDMFNDILTRSSRMPLVIKLLNQIEQYNPSTAFVNPGHTRLREFAIYDKSRRYEAVKEHMAIADALSERDLERFKSAMQTHLTNVKEAAMRGYLERQKVTSRVAVS